MSNDRHNDIVVRLTALIADLQRGGSPLQEGLGELVHRATRQVPGAQYAGVTVVSSAKGLSTVAATSLYATVLDEIQQRYQEGPCAWAAFRHHTVHIDDMENDKRWPRYRRDALSRTPVRSVLAFEVRVDNDLTGALNFYAEQPRAFDQNSMELGVIFAGHVGLAWSIFRRTDEFRSALASRDIIGQAKGILMERFQVDSGQAFDLLTHLSRESHSKLLAVAQKVIDTKGVSDAGR